MDRITRRELKTDKFAQEVTHTVEFLGLHRKQFVWYAAAAAAILVLVLGFWAYRGRRSVQAQDALTEALRAQEAQVAGPSGNPLILTFPTQAEKDKATTKAFNDLIAEYPGSGEAAVAKYYLGVIAADGGQVAQAEKMFQDVAASGPKSTAALAKFALAQVYRAENKTPEAEKLLRGLIADPTSTVSQEQATITLARILGETNPAEARKLLEPLRTSRSPVSRAAITALGEISSK